MPLELSFDKGQVEAIMAWANDAGEKSPQRRQEAGQGRCQQQAVAQIHDAPAFAFVKAKLKPPCTARSRVTSTPTA